MPPVLAVLDANVLVPAVLCDLLLRAASADLYRLLWTEDILVEVHRTLVGDFGKTPEQIDRRIAAMKAAFPEALVTQHTTLISTMTNDPKDRHVLAAAVAAGAPVIVTSNLRDFPRQALEPYDVSAQSPDQFLSTLFDRAPDVLVEVLMRQAHALRHPPKSVADLVGELTTFAPTFVARLRQRLPSP